MTTFPFTISVFEPQRLEPLASYPMSEIERDRFIKDVKRIAEAFDNGSLSHPPMPPLILTEADVKLINAKMADVADFEPIPWPFPDGYEIGGFACVAARKL